MKLPRTLLGGRIRTSTVGLMLSFFAVLALWVMVRPEPLLTEEVSYNNGVVTVRKTTQTGKTTTIVESTPTPSPTPRASVVPTSTPTATPKPAKATPVPTPTPTPAGGLLFPAPTPTATPTPTPGTPFQG